MNLGTIATLCTALLAASISHGQSATLVADRAAAAAGSEITLTASTHYTGAPTAVGWSIELPKGWTFVATGGANVPQVAPETGATDTLEWAYTQVPANEASFSVRVKAAGHPASVQLRAKVLLRIDGKLRIVEVTPVNL